MTLDNNSENKHVVFIANFLKYVVTEVVLFSVVVFLNTDISQGNVAKHLRCGEMFIDSIITNVLLIVTMKKSLKISQYLTKLRRTKICANFWATLSYR